MKAGRRSAMLKNREPRWVHFYLWTVDGAPVYVGQASDVEERAKRHEQGRSVFGREFLAKLPLAAVQECRYLYIKVWDIPRGSWANGIEAGLIDLYGTRFPQGQNRLERKKTDSEVSALAEARRRKREEACLT